MPEEIEEIRISFKDLSPQQMETTGIDISKLLVAIGFAKSRSEANRLIPQGAVSIDGRVISSSTILDYDTKSGSIIKVGKRRFVKVVNSDILNSKQ